MQVIGLPRHVTRGAALAPHRRAVPARWRRAPSPARAGRTGSRRRSQRSRTGVRTTRCGARPGAPSCSNAGDTGSARALQGASSRASWSAARSPRRPSCAATGRAPQGASGPAPDACPKAASPQAPARSSSATPSPSRPTPDGPRSSRSPHAPRRQADLRPGPETRHRPQRQALPRQAPGPHALPPRGHPGRWRLRVQGQLRDRTPAPQQRTLRTPAPVAQAQRPCRALRWPRLFGQPGGWAKVCSG